MDTTSGIGDEIKMNKELELMKKEKLIICNIAWMRDYNGITHGDMPKYYEEDADLNNSAGEIYNFQEFNGNCYGYMEKYGNMEIERYFKHLLENRDKIKGVTVVWCAADISKKTKIVGWYKNSVLYRNHRYVVDFFPEENDENGYNCTASIDSCYLLAQEQRTFVIDEVLNKEELSKLKDVGIWYETEQNHSNAVNKIKKYIESYEGDFSNEGILSRLLDEKADSSQGFSYEDFYQKGMQVLHIDAIEAIKYFNSARSIKQSADVLFNTGVCLQNINCFDRAIDLYIKSLEMQRENLEVLLHILVCYAKKGDVENTIVLSKKIIRILKFNDKPSREDMLVDVYFILSNAYIYRNQYKDARNTIKKILDVRQEAEDRMFVQEVLEIIEEVEQDYFYRC